MYVKIAFDQRHGPETLQKLEREANWEIPIYLEAMRDGFAQGLTGLEQQLRRAIANEMPGIHRELVGIAFLLVIGKNGWTEVHAFAYPTTTTMPEPLFQIGPHPEAYAGKGREGHKERLRFRCDTLDAGIKFPDLPLNAVAGSCETQTEQISQRVARDGFPRSWRRAIVAVGQAFRYINPLERLRDPQGGPTAAVRYGGTQPLPKLTPAGDQKATEVILTAEGELTDGPEDYEWDNEGEDRSNSQWPGIGLN